MARLIGYEFNYRFIMDKSHHYAGLQGASLYTPNWYSSNPITGGFEAGISKGGPTCEHAHANFHSWHEVDDLLLK